MENLKFLLSHFDFARACRALNLRGGGNRLKTVGYDVGILHDLVGVGALGAPAIP